MCDTDIDRDLQESADQLLQELHAHDLTFYRELFMERNRLSSLEVRNPSLRPELRKQHDALDVQCAQHKQKRVETERMLAIVYQQQVQRQRHAELIALIAPRPDDVHAAIAHASDSVYTDTRLRHARLRDIVAHALPDELAFQLLQFCGECLLTIGDELSAHRRQRHALGAAMEDIAVRLRFVHLSVYTPRVASSAEQIDPRARLERAGAAVRVHLLDLQSLVDACEAVKCEMDRIRRMYSHRHG